LSNLQNRCAERRKNGSGKTFLFLHVQHLQLYQLGTSPSDSLPSLQKFIHGGVHGQLRPGISEMPAGHLSASSAVDPRYRYPCSNHNTARRKKSRAKTIGSPESVTKGTLLTY
jgi:hypothetical protein